MADKQKNTSAPEATRFRMGDNGPMVSAEPELAEALQTKGGQPSDTRSSTEQDTVDELGIARTSRFEQQFANKPGGGRVPGAERLRGDLRTGDEAGDDGTDAPGTVGVRETEEVVATTSTVGAPVADQPKGSRRGSSR